jgi:hypothetical protein
MVAGGVTGFVQKSYAPTVEQAKLGVSERRRADKLPRTAKSFDGDKRELTERFSGLQTHLAPMIELTSLSKQEYSQLVRYAQERVNVIKAERTKAEEKYKIDHERSPRIDNLVRVEGTSAGAAKTFPQHGLKTIEKTGVDVSKVQWTDVERAAIYESIMQRRQDPKDVLSAIIKNHLRWSMR